MAQKQGTKEEALLLDDIASLAALINKHKSTQPKYSGYHKSSSFPPPHVPTSYNNKFTNLSLQPKHIPPQIAQQIPPQPIPQQQPQQQTPLQRIPSNPYKLVNPKPAPSILLPIPLQQQPTLPHNTVSRSTPYVRRGNKLVRKSTLKTSPHKKFILKSPVTLKSILSSPSLRVKQHILAVAKSTGLQRKGLSLKPTLASRAILASYFRRGNSLVRKAANKYIRPGVLIQDKKPLGTLITVAHAACSFHPF
jgi:hypothetical protein